MAHYPLIRDIKPPPSPIPPPHPQQREPKKRRVWRTFLVSLFFFLFLIAGGGYVAIQLLGTMHIAVTPRVDIYPVDTEFTVAKNPQPLQIPGESIEVTKSKQSNVPATGFEEVEEKASGAIIIYNAHSTNPQTLIATTRFETPDGLIYRVPKSITIPGATTAEGELVPSSIEAVVYADKPGQAYNKELAEFTIPGFKGSPQYKGFYAKSKTPLAGGFSGKQAVAREGDMEDAERLQKEELQKEVVADLHTHIPSGLTLLEDAYEVTTNTTTRTDEAEIIIMETTATAKALVFQKENVVQALASMLNIEEGAYDIHATEIPIKISAKSLEEDRMRIRIEGEMRLVWQVPKGSLQQAITAAGKASTLQSIFETYPAIGEAAVTFSPSWIRHIPQKAERIIINVK